MKWGTARITCKTISEIEDWGQLEWPMCHGEGDFDLKPIWERVWARKGTDKTRSWLCVKNLTILVANIRTCDFVRLFF